MAERVEKVYGPFDADQQKLLDLRTELLHLQEYRRFIASVFPGKEPSYLGEMEQALTDRIRELGP